MHSACQSPILPICRAQVGQGIPNVSIEVVGENLAVIVVFNRDLMTSLDYMYIFDWKTGRSKSVSIAYIVVILTLIPYQ